MHESLEATRARLIEQLQASAAVATSLVETAPPFEAALALGLRARIVELLDAMIATTERPGADWRGDG